MNPHIYYKILLYTSDDLATAIAFGIINKYYYSIFCKFVVRRAGRIRGLCNKQLQPHGEWINGVYSVIYNNGISTIEKEYEDKLYLCLSRPNLRTIRNKYLDYYSFYQYRGGLLYEIEICINNVYKKYDWCKKCRAEFSGDVLNFQKIEKFLLSVVGTTACDSMSHWHL